MTGLEPANNGATIHCRNPLATPALSYIIVFSFQEVYFLSYYTMLTHYVLIQLNGKPFNCASNLSLIDLLVYLNLNLYSTIVEYNSEVIQFTSLNKIILRQGDKVEFLTIVGGG